MTSWTFLTTHARVMLLVAHDPGCACANRGQPGHHRTQPFGIIDLVEVGYMVKEKNGRRNRYHIQAHRPLPELVIGRDLSQLSHGLTGRYGTVGSVMDTR